MVIGPRDYKTCRQITIRRVCGKQGGKLLNEENNGRKSLRRKAEVDKFREVL